MDQKQFDETTSLMEFPEFVDKLSHAMVTNTIDEGPGGGTHGIDRRRPSQARLEPRNILEMEKPVSIFNFSMLTSLQDFGKLQLILLDLGSASAGSNQDV